MVQASSTTSITPTASNSRRPSMMIMTESTTNTSSIVKDGSLEISLNDIQSSQTRVSDLQADAALANSVTHVAVHLQKSALANADATRATPKDIICLLKDIGAICHRVVNLSISLDTSPLQQQSPMEFPLAALTAFLEQVPQHLVSIKLASAVISSVDSQDWVALEQAMLQATNLKDMRLEGCEPAPNTPSLDLLLQALAVAPVLEQLALSGTNLTHTGLCTGPSLALLVGKSNSTLKTLTIWGGKRRLQTTDVCALIQALESSPTSALRELTLHARGLNSTCGRALSRCLAVNTSLERLILNVSDNNLTKTKSCSDYVITTTLLARALQTHNRTLRLLSLDYCPEEDNDCCYFPEGDSHDYEFYEAWQIIAHDHDKSSLLKSAETVREAYTHMLHSNPALEVLWMNLDNSNNNDDYDVDEGDEDYDSTPPCMVVTSEMEMLLRLNRHGIRQRLFENANNTAANSEGWIDAIASQSYDINALFYLVSRNPSLCSTTASSQQQLDVVGAKRYASTETESSNKRQRS